MSILSGKVGLPWRPRRAIGRPAAHPLSLRRMTSLTLALLAVTVAVAIYGMCGVVDRTPLVRQSVAWSVCGMLVLLAIVILLLGRYTTGRLLRHIESQLRRLVRSEELVPISGRVPDELQQVCSALADYVAHVYDRMDNLRLQKKELDIQMRVADAERRHTEAVIFSISDAVLVIDSFGELVLANTAAERLFSFRLAEYRHRPIDRVVNDASLTALLREAREGVRFATPPRSYAPVRPGAVEPITPDASLNEPDSFRRQVDYSVLREGKVQTFNITLSTVQDSQGQARGVVAVFHDITREREIARMKTDFVSAVSHELRTPLSSIKAYIEMLVDGEARDEDTRKDFYHIIESETDRLQRLITKILDISRIESGVMEVRRTTIQLNTIVREVHDVMLPQAAGKAIDLVCEPADNLPPLWADRDLVYQAVLNVVSNAVKYTPEHGRVSVRTGIDPGAGHLSVVVTDNGMGIHPEDLPHLFEKFFRSRESQQVAKGTGLGLNLVKHIVETVHHGEIAVTSECGAGTTMTLRFPPARPEPLRRGESPLAVG